MTTSGALIGGIEAGGTKFVLAMAAAPDRLTVREEIPTRDPDTTLAQAADWFAAQGEIAALGIASFGPVDLLRSSPQWGHILDTSKPGWSGCDVAGHFASRLGVPIGFDTDVNAAALAEYRLGAGATGGVGNGSLAYITVGTGIGGGLVLDGTPVHGIAHPEMGHYFPRRHRGDRDFGGVCPLHGDCLEGLASGPAIHARWGKSLSELPGDHPAHAVIAYYLAQLCQAVFAITAVETIVLGGGVMKTPGLIERVRQVRSELDREYLPGGERHRIVPPALGDNSGIAGALMLAARALDEG